MTVAGAFASSTEMALLALGGIALMLTTVCLAIFSYRAHSTAARMRTQLAALKTEQLTQAARWQAAIESVPEGLMLLDADMRLTQWNSHFPEFCGVPTDVLQPGMHIEDILRAQAAAGEFGPVDVHQEAQRRAERIRLGKSSGTIERLRPNGQIMELRRTSMTGGGFITLYSDVTTRRKAEDQLRQAQKMEAVGLLTAGIAHDFNNLMTLITGNLGMAATAIEANRTNRAATNISLAQRGAERATALTRRLVNFSRNRELEPQPVNANRIVADMTDLMQHSLSTIELRTVLANEIWDVLSDPSEIENALLNLAVNARDALPNGGQIIIETANVYLDEAYAAANSDVTPGQYVMIAVRDDGTGMAPNEVAHAFEPFYTTKDVGKGSGLGLSQVSGFIKQSGGHVRIYSEQGRGTTVKLYLPRHVELLEGSIAAQGPVSRAELPRAKQGETVLVVEDDADVLAYATATLESLDYHVIGTQTPALALSSLETHPGISMLLSDVTLPKMNGPELAVQALLRRPGLAVLFTTGYPSQALLHHKDLDLTFKVVRKPFSRVDLAGAVRSALDGQPPCP